MAEKETTERNLKDEVKYVINALGQRKEALKSAGDSTTNPLDRLIVINKLEELDIVIKYLESVVR